MLRERKTVFRHVRLPRRLRPFQTYRAAEEEGYIHKIAAVGAGTAAYCHALPKCPGTGEAALRVELWNAAPEISKDEGH